MKLIGNDIALFLSGQPVPVPECNIVVTQPTIKQIVAFGEEEFLNTVQFLGKSEEFLTNMKKGNSELNNLTNFQIIMILLQEEQTLKQNMLNFFELIFPIYDVEISEFDIFFKLKNESNIVGMINNFNYENFFKIIGNLFILHSESEEIEYDPANNKAKEIAEKLKKGRQKAKEIKQKKSGDDEVSIFGTFISVLSVGMQMDINILFQYTPFQIYDVYNRYWKKVGSDFYQKISTTPLMDVSKIDAPEEWTKNIYR